MTADTLRPATAAARFGVCERTLARWARSGLIGRSQVGAAVWYSAQDVADLIARNTAKRTIVPMSTQPAATASGWKDDPFWSPATRQPLQSGGRRP